VGDDLVPVPEDSELLEVGNDAAEVVDFPPASPVMAPIPASQLTEAELSGEQQVEQKRERHV